MKEQILKLRKEGKTYTEIRKILGCSTSTISYHCGVGQKEKNNVRQNNRCKNLIIRKTKTFKHTPKGNEVFKRKELKTKKDVMESIRKFQKRNNINKLNGGIDKSIDKTFTWEDVVKKFGENTICYLSGEKINLYVNNYNFDHIIPVSKGGLNTLENLGVLSEKVNRMKTDMTPEELIDLCKKILEYNNYKVIKK